MELESVSQFSHGRPAGPTGPAGTSLPPSQHRPASPIPRPAPFLPGRGGARRRAASSFTSSAGQCSARALATAHCYCRCRGLGSATRAYLHAAREERRT